MIDRQTPPFPGIPVSAPILSGPLFDICTAVNNAIRTLEGRTDFCIACAAATRDILRAKGWKSANVLRVTAIIFPPSDRRDLYGVTLGSDGDGTRMPAGEWFIRRGRLAAWIDRERKL
jgi:hypothetical protein